MTMFYSLNLARCDRRAARAFWAALAVEPSADPDGYATAMREVHEASAEARVAFRDYMECLT